MKTFTEYLEEKLLVVNNGAREGQVIFLAGGGGSGKSFAAKHFMEADKYRTLNVDDWKELYMKMPDRYPELKDVDLKNPKDVFFLHKFVKEKGIKNAAISQLMRAASQGVEQPNILFDITAKDISDISEIVPGLLEAGYKRKNIHIIWILTNYSIAVKSNRKRSRVVPEDILLKTHEGAANTVHSMLYKGKYPKSIDGGIWVILNNPEHTVLYNPDTAAETGNLVIKDFKYLTVKKPGRSINKDAAQNQLLDWIQSNVPKTKATKHIFGENQNIVLESELADLIKQHTDPYEFASDAIKKIQSGEIKLNPRGAASTRELIQAFYKYHRLA